MTKEKARDDEEEKARVGMGVSPVRRSKAPQPPYHQIHLVILRAYDVLESWRLFRA